MSVLQEVPYDEERRLHLLKRLRDRRQEQVTDTVNAKFSDHKGNDLLVLKCDYSPHIGKLRLHKEFRKLLKLLRAEIGEAFLAAGRLVVAHPLHTNAFLDTHAYNFPFVENFVDGKKRRGWGGGFFASTR